MRPRPTKPPPVRYHSVAVKPDTFNDLHVWLEALSIRWGWRATMNDVIAYLIDEAGVPKEANGE